MSYGTGFEILEVDGTGTKDAKFFYDEDGNVNSLLREGTNLELTYNSFDQLSLIKRGERVVQYLHDALGNKVVVKQGKSEKRLVVGPTLVEDLESPHIIGDGNGNLLMGYVYLGEHPLLRFDSNGPVYYLTDAAGSVISLVDSNAQRIARFDYDAFGNIRKAEGPGAIAPTEVGGDFRFHGAWLDADSGLYDFRLREYDSQTGTFLSRDPALMDPSVPETMHPYLFALGNPHIYRDPSGAVTSVERAVQQFVLFAAKQAADEVIGHALSLLVQSSLQIAGGLIPSLGQALAYLDQAEEGVEGLFEDVVTDTLCASGGKELMWIEPWVNPDGKPSTNGRRCPETTPISGGARQLRKPNDARPDMLISYFQPTQVKELGEKSFLVGEIKITLYAAHRKWKAGNSQRQAIHMHAAKYQYAPVAVLFALAEKRPGEKKKRGPITILLQQKFRSPRVFLFIVKPPKL